MTVQQLIDELWLLPRDMPVRVDYDAGEGYHLITQLALLRDEGFPEHGQFVALFTEASLDESDIEN